MSFLAGSGEMARRIREFDWEGHPIGPPETWPQSLKSALGICLNSAFPTAIYWGSELRLLYNDEWSLIPGPRHPACLGEPAKDVWSDIWHVIEPQFTQVIVTGEGLFLDDQLLPMRRFGFEEETYWSYSFTPIRGEEGAIEGIFNSGHETSSKVLKQQQTAFFLKLIDALRKCEDIQGIMKAACQMLGEHLKAMRVGIREVDPEVEQLSVRSEWTAEGVAEAGPSLPWASLGSIAACLEGGRVARIDCTEDLEDAEALALSRLGAASVLAVPWHRWGKLSAALFIHRSKAKPWSDEEVATVEQVFARVIQAISEERSKGREKTMMHEIDHRARNMLGVSQALIRLVNADDVETFRKSLLERMGSLGSTLQLLSKANWAGAYLEDILRGELAPYMSEEDTRVTLDGPKVMVASEKAQPLAMALHELVTNAVKYGALSGSEGLLDVSWKIDADGKLEIDWLEENVGPDSDLKNERSGFGTKLLEVTISGQLGGRFSRQISAGNLHCKLEVPS